MSKSVKLRIEEYLPAGAFLETSFSRDRAELEQRFSEFTPEYLTGFQSQLQIVGALEDSLVLTEEQKGITQSLYVAKDEMNKELNFLSFYFKRAGLNTSSITSAKKDLIRTNVEGAYLKLKAIIQVVDANTELLESKGMTAGYSALMTLKNKVLHDKNVMQNQLMDQRGQLTEDNVAVYKSLYTYISNIAEAGKIFYEGKGKRDEYVISRLISRMRAPERGNSGDVSLTN